jgi:choline dehydrogenase-like flavoprotein
MRDYNHWAVLGVLSELLPQPDNRVTLADVKDEFGLPVAYFHYSLCDNDRRNVAYATDVMRQIWLEAGAQDTLTIKRYAHLVGGCRMGFTPEDSVVNSDHQVWGVPNLFIADGSVFCTQGAANPALVIQALASRLAERLTSGQVATTTPPVREKVPVTQNG